MSHVGLLGEVPDKVRQVQDRLPARAVTLQSTVGTHTHTHTHMHMRKVRCRPPRALPWRSLQRAGGTPSTLARGRMAPANAPPPTSRAPAWPRAAHGRQGDGQPPSRSPCATPRAGESRTDLAVFLEPLKELLRVVRVLVKVSAQHGTRRQSVRAPRQRRGGGWSRAKHGHEPSARGAGQHRHLPSPTASLALACAGPGCGSEACRHRGAHAAGWFVLCCAAEPLARAVSSKGYMCSMCVASWAGFGSNTRTPRETSGALRRRGSHCHRRRWR